MARLKMNEARLADVPTISSTARYLLNQLYAVTVTNVTEISQEQLVTRLLAPLVNLFHRLEVSDSPFFAVLEKTMKDCKNLDMKLPEVFR